MERGLHYDRNQLSRLIEKAKGDIDKLKANLIKRLAVIGETAVTIARDRGSYTDRTSNLRSSIGYMIVMDGEIINLSEPEQAGSGTDGNEGIAQGKALLERLKGEIPQSGAVLVVCAGMNYAWYVENVHGYDVLKSAELEAEQLAKELLGN